MHPTQAIEIFGNIFIWHERSFILVFWEEASLVGDDPFYVKFWVNRPPLEKIADFQPIFTRSFSAVTPSEKSSINANRKSITRFPMSLRWSSYVAPKSPKGGLKTHNLLQIWPASVKLIYMTQYNSDNVCLLSSLMNVKLGKSKNAVNADRIMKFVDENELNNIWTIRCNNSETVRDRMLVLFGFR